MSHQFSARSPFWQILLAIQVFAFIVIFISANPADLDGGVDMLELTIPLSGQVLLCTLLVTIICGWFAVRSYNQLHPKSRIRIGQAFPPELIESDERLFSLTARATRKVYLYHNFALPILAAIILIGQPSAPVTASLVGLLTVGHYITYWTGIAPVLDES